MAGNLIIISAPSGAGKTTLVSETLRRDSGLRPSVSYTSRAPRMGEIAGEHYHFVAGDEFAAMIERGEFLEWAEVHNRFYGTSRAQVESLLAQGFDVTLAIDVQGAATTKRLFPAAVSIFVLPPNKPRVILPTIQAAAAANNPPKAQPTTIGKPSPPK